MLRESPTKRESLAFIPALLSASSNITLSGLQDSALSELMASSINGFKFPLSISGFNMSSSILETIER